MNAARSNAREERALARSVSAGELDAVATSIGLDRSRVNHVAAEGGVYA